LDFNLLTSSNFKPTRLVHGEKRRYFVPEMHPKLKHDVKGRVSFATVSDAGGNPLAASQFFITLGDNLDYLNGKAAVFGQVAEGFDVLEQFSAAIVDEEERPMVDIRIKHTIVLDDPFDEVPGMKVPERSPSPTPEMLKGSRLREEDLIVPDMSPEELEKEQRRKEAEARALTLEMVGDLPFADIRPPENILFVCKLNPVTRDEDLELIFSRFGAIRRCVNVCAGSITFTR
jgi:peptidyl-prolyl cis-trans isomerase-like 4